MHEQRAFASRLDRLFRAVTNPDGSERSYRQVAVGIQELTGTRVGATTLHALRTGLVTDPRMSTVEAIARYFGVPVSYFFDDDLASQVDAEIQFLRAMRSNDIQALALRANGLSRESLEMLAAMVNKAREAEGLDRPGRKVYRKKPTSE
jgi:transcriptional regulator with XRE-family HTH domain